MFHLTHASESHQHFCARADIMYLRFFIISTFVVMLNKISYQTLKSDLDAPCESSSLLPVPQKSVILSAVKKKTEGKIRLN